MTGRPADPAVVGQVVVVGAGPTGLTLAILLRMRGFDAVVLEREASVAKLPQAHVLNARSLEIFEEIGIADRCLEAAGKSRLSGPVRWVESIAGRSYGQLLVAQDSSQKAFSRYDAINLAQNVLEPILYDRFVELGGVVRFGAQVTDVESGIDGVTLSVRSSDGSDTTITCDWVVGCDGAGSTVRRSAGIVMEGPPSLAKFMTIYFKGSFDRFVDGEPGALHWIGGPEVRGVIISFDQGENHALLVPIGDIAVDAFSEETARNFVQKAIGSPDFVFELTGISSWNMSAQVANSFRSGNIILAGDACHRFPPTGGLGLNSGVQDAHNLAWKLSAVLSGKAAGSLLDSYEAERRPVALANTAQSVANLMQMSEIDESLGVVMLAPVCPEAGHGPISRFDPSQLGIDEGLAGADTKRALVQQAIDNQRGHFGDSIGVHLGFSYAAGAFVADGSPPPSKAPDHYAPDAHPGARLPWFVCRGDNGEEGSCLDLIDRDRATLLTFDPQWAPLAGDMLLVRVLSDRSQAAGELLRIGERGAVLVRPDGHVGWRTTMDAASGAASLGDALGFVFP